MPQTPPDALVNRQLADALQCCRQGQFDRAKTIYAALMRAAPQRLEPYLNCGQIGIGEGAYAEALSYFEQALALRADLPPALAGAGRALLALGRADEALERFQRLQAVDAGSDMAARGAGEALRQLGRMAEARTALERAAALAPEVAGHHYALAQLGRFVEGDARLAGLERLETRMASLPPPAQCDLHFALGKAYDDLGRHQAAFAHWLAGNTIRRRHLDYNEAMFLGMLRALVDAFPPQVVAARAGAGDPSDVPVFVVGMPRSGTTLVEQVLASHPAVFGAGESMYLHQLLGEGLVGADFPAGFATVEADAVRRLGARYVAHMQAKAPEAKRVVDKLPANFMLCGLIHLALPHARIIHVRRDPVDTCFSCYANLFAQDIDYAYDLAELGRYYRAYDALMEHWRRVLPAEAMIEVRYEALVADLAGEARRIVEYCGLAWDERCLAFHQTERVVHTLSAAQVRQPLYRSAIGRAEPYRQWLEPLLAALDGAS